MATVLPFRGFKLTNVVESQFVQSTSTQNRDFALEDLARSGLLLEDMAIQAPSMLRLPDKAIAGYTIPYFGLDGQPLCNAAGELVMYRVRFKYPEFAKESRYGQPSGETLAKHGLPPVLPYFHPLSFVNSGTEVICCEGEKKTAAVLHKLGLPAFGIGGCQMWRSPTGNGAVHPWIIKYLELRGIKSVRIVPDGDIFRYDICNAYGTFARALQDAGIDVQIVRLEGKIDDLLCEWGPEAGPRFSAVPTIPLLDLVQSPASLISKFGLAYKADAKDRPVVYQHSSNITKLLEQHRAAFPEIWRNTDTAQLMLGETPAVPELTEMEITNYFQHNLGFHNVKTNQILDCMCAQARKNAKSPFLEYIKGQVWDGEPRLDRWMVDFWGCQDTEFVREVSKRWLLSACARLDKPGCEVHFMLIVVGPQATGKTSMPRILFRGNNVTIYGEHNDKDLHLLFHSALCVGFDELDTFTKREAKGLKAMVTRSTDVFRPPYAASNEAFPRRFVLYGCGNMYEFLQGDPSGYRRYPIVEVAQLLDFKGLEGVRDQLWAEAWHRYSGGEKYWEVDGASAEAEKYTAPDPLKDKVEGWVYAEMEKKQSMAVKDGVLYFTMGRLLEGINMEREIKNTQLTREIAGILRAMEGMQQVNSRKEVVPGVFGRYYHINVQE